MAPSCKIELARFSAKLRIQDGAKCGKNGVIPPLKIIFLTVPKGKKGEVRISEKSKFAVFFKPSQGKVLGENMFLRYLGNSFNGFLE